MLIAEFDQIKLRWADCCLGNEARVRALHNKPSTDFEFVNTILNQVNEMKSVLEAGLHFPIEPYPELLPVLKFLKVANSSLSAAQFIQIRRVTSMAIEVIEFCNKQQTKYSYLTAPVAGIELNPGILRLIETVFDESGNILSSASDNLQKIRKELQQNRYQSERLYQRVIQRLKKDDWLAETGESWRHGRRVIAVHSVFKRLVKGTIHDISTTGKTVFIEPEETIEINNLLLEREYEEQSEIHKILFELSGKIRKYHHLIECYYKLLLVFDDLRSRALFAINLNASLPVLKETPGFKISKGFHPLLYLQNKQTGKETIPFDLTLGRQNRILVISGPNAGGKSVCLKAVGLLQLMLQSGLLIPVSPDSEIGLFHSVLCDMGDTQSLEYELSTYSARLKNMKVFLEQADEYTLFLIDELGTGTDPQLGGPLAESILIELNKKKATGIVTTHFINLKTLAAHADGMINGSMAFDSVNLLPLYRLIIGKPGGSYTFVVAQRSGLPAPVIQRAKSKAEKKVLMLERLLNEAEHEKSVTEKLKAELLKKEKASDEVLRKAEKLSQELEQISIKTEQQLLKKELILLRRSEDVLNRFFREFKQARNKKAVIEQYIERFKSEKEKLKPVPDEKAVAELLRRRMEQIRPGVSVTLNNGKAKGTVREVKKDKVVVQFGSMKVQCSIESLIPVETCADEKTKRKKE